MFILDIIGVALGIVMYVAIIMAVHRLFIKLLESFRIFELFKRFFVWLLGKNEKRTIP